MNTSPNAGLKALTTPLPELTPEQSRRLSALGIEPSSVPREIVTLVPDDGFDYGEIPLPPQITDALGPEEDQQKLDAWIAAGGWQDDGFMRFFGLEPDEA